MTNYFYKRTAEVLRDVEAFLAIVSPEPLFYFLGDYAKNGQLYDRLFTITGTPGSGKTTLSRLFEYPSVVALLRNTTMQTYQSLLDALGAVDVVEEERPRVLGCRLPLEIDYRDFWEFPYPEETRGRMMAALIQSRAVLAWIRHLMATGIQADQINIVPRSDAQAALAAIGGTNGRTVLERARLVEEALYGIVNALVPPPLDDLPEGANGSYRPFDVIEKIAIPWPTSNSNDRLELQPLVILDDAHHLHPGQFRLLRQWLAKRELRVARWLLSRLDIMEPAEALAAVTTDPVDASDLPGVTVHRDTAGIVLGSGVNDRRRQRTDFRKMAKDMAGRYLSQMSTFSRRNLTSLTDLLLDKPEQLAPSHIRELVDGIEAAARKYSITSARIEALSKLVNEYFGAGGQDDEDLRAAMLRVLIFRYLKRTEGKSLFGEELDPEPAKPLRADESVLDAARLQLLHRFGRPYYYGIDDLCDASSDNAEQFLRLAAKLVDRSATEIVRDRSPALPARVQHKLLREAATDTVRTWGFPVVDTVRNLGESMGRLCITKSLEDNASLGAGANALGILQADFENLPAKWPALARVLHFGVAYNAFTLVSDYDCKNKTWCLIELGGVYKLYHGLTLKRGGFIESTPEDLARLMEGGT